jgi:hypothetical protein
MRFVGFLLLFAAGCQTRSVMSGLTGDEGGRGGDIGDVGGAGGSAGGYIGGVAGGGGTIGGVAGGGGRGGYYGDAGGYWGVDAGAPGRDGTGGVVCAGGPGGAAGTGLAFMPPVSYLLHRGTSLAAVGDLNGDGKPDIITSNKYEAVVPVTNGAAGGSGESGPPNVSVFLGVGLGSLQAPLHYPTADQVTSIAIADLNGDGKPDLAVSESHDVAIMSNNGDGSLAAPVRFATGLYPTIAVGDVNGDGKADIVVANRAYPDGHGGEANGDVAVFMNMGGGSFVANNYAAGTSPTAVAIADLNGDGKPDLAVPSGTAVSVLLNNGDGTFAPAASFGIGTSPYSVAVADLNGDGKPDLAVANGSAYGASVLMNIGGGTFAAAVDYVTDYGAVLVGDLNGDGKPDLVAGEQYTSASCQTLEILLNAGNGTFGAPVLVPSPGYVTLGDLNQDGKLDLVAFNVDGVALLLNGR